MPAPFASSAKSYPSDLVKRIDRLTIKAVKLAAKSASACRYESLEYHLVHWQRPWSDVVAVVRSMSPRLSMLVASVVLDDVSVNEGRPLGDPLAALPLDVLTVEEALALEDAGFRLEVAIRFWPGVDGARHNDHDARVACSQRRARRRAYTYYRSTGDAFIYSRRFPRSLRSD